MAVHGSGPEVMNGESPALRESPFPEGQTGKTGITAVGEKYLHVRSAEACVIRWWWGRSQ